MGPNVMDSLDFVSETSFIVVLSRVVEPGSGEKLDEMLKVVLPVVVSVGSVAEMDEPSFDDTCDTVLPILVCMVSLKTTLELD